MDNDSDDTVIVTSTLEDTDYTIDMSTLSIPTFTGNVTINGTSSSNYSIGATGSSGQFFTTNGSNGTSWSTNPYVYTSAGQPGLKVTGDSEFDGDVKIKGVSLAKTLEAINERLAILHPDPAKLEKYAALKKAYEHYKTLERLIGED